MSFRLPPCSKWLRTHRMQGLKAAFSCPARVGAAVRSETPTLRMFVYWGQPKVTPTAQFGRKWTLSRHSGRSALLRKNVRQPLKVHRVLRDTQSFKSKRGSKRRSEASMINSGRSPQFHELSDEPSTFVDIELHQAFVSHFQQEGLASFSIHVARFMTSYSLSGFSRSALRIFSRSFSTTRLLPSSSALNH